MATECIQMWTPPFFLTTFGKYYFNKKCWKELNALDSYVTNQMFTELWKDFINFMINALRLFFCILDFSNQEPNKAFELQVPTYHECLKEMPPASHN